MVFFMRLLNPVGAGQGSKFDDNNYKKRRDAIIILKNRTNTNWSKSKVVIQNVIHY